MARTLITLKGDYRKEIRKVGDGEFDYDASE
jgi:hypothetical protein